jgi:phage terminase small subunit
MADLTVQQQLFCQKYIECKGNASEAYRQSYNCENSNNHTIRNEAYLLLQNPDISLTIETLQLEHAERHKVTIDSLTAELEELKQLSKEDKQYSAGVSAVMGKAKIHGFDKTILGGDVNLKTVKVVNMTGKKE